MWPGLQHPPAKPQNGLSGGDRQREDATVPLPPPQALPSLPPPARLPHGAFAHPHPQGNGGSKCPALWVEHKMWAFPKYSWPMHHPSWLALLPAFSYRLEKKGPTSSVGCLIDHFTRQNSRAASYWQKHLVQLSFPKSEKLFALESLCRLPQFPPRRVCHLFSPTATPAFWVPRRWSAMLLNCLAHNGSNSRGQLPHKSDGIFPMRKRAWKGFRCASVLAHLCWPSAK